MSRRFLHTMAVALTVFSLTAAAVPLTLSYGGRLTAADGAPLVGPVTLGIKLYHGANADVPSTVVVADQAGVALHDGIFQIALTLAPGDLDGAFGPAETWIEITDRTHGKTYPKQRYLAVPYALRVPVDGTSVTYDAAGQLTVASLGGDLTGTPGAAVVANLSGHALAPATPTINQVLQWNGAAWTPTTVGGVGTPESTTATNAVAGTGAGLFKAQSTYELVFRKLNAGAGISVTQNADDVTIASTVTPVTSVASGTGLTGGPITTTGTLSLANTTVGAGAYTRANITVDAQGRLTAASNGASVNLATETTGTLAVASGGTGAASAAANLVFASPSGSAGAPTFRALAAADVPAEADPQVGANTTGYLPKWNGTALVTGAVFDDGAGKIGIGTSTPLASLHILTNSVGAGALKITETSGTAARLELRNTINEYQYIDFTPNSTSETGAGTPDFGGRLSYNSPVADGFAFFTGGSGTSSLAVSATGNVGVGLTAPGQKLSVAGTIESTTGGVKFPDGSIQTHSATAHILIVDEKANGSYAGASVTGAWQTRVLNSEKLDTAGLAALAGNQVTLAAGTYFCEGTTPAYSSGQHKARLRNVTDGTTVLVGTTEYGGTGGGTPQTASRLMGQFTIAAGKALELQHYTLVARATDGLGTATFSGEVEVYSTLECWRN